jgi:phosphoribosylformylglycinamidine cyclo-ligase
VPSKRPILYKDAGVDVAAGDAFVARIRAAVDGTRTASVLGGVGGFGGLFRADFGLDDPVLVASADGVGTKLKLAFATGRHAGVGGDLVRHCANDVAVLGARPLFFLDYLATGRLDPDVLAQLVEGMAAACRDEGIALLGGETAEMPGFYADDEYDAAGFMVGVVDRARILDGSSIRPGDRLVGFASAGLHTNGYSLARKVLLDHMGLRLEAQVPELGMTLGAALLAPHRGYLAALEPLLERRKIRALAHVTGGGFPGNLPRVLPEGLGARLRRGSWEVPPLFHLIQSGGGVAEEEMYRTFNMGIGMVVVVGPDDLHDVEHSLERRGEPSFLIGYVASGAGVVFE